MSRRFTWSILLLLLTSVQSFAVACSVSCALMAMPMKTASTGTTPGMEHCENMSSAAMQNKSATQSIQALQMTSSTTCCDDLSFAKDSGTAERTDIVLHSVANASVAEATHLPALAQRRERPPAWSVANLPSNLTPRASNLRI